MVEVKKNLQHQFYTYVYTLLVYRDSVDLAVCKKIFEEDFSVMASDEDCEIVRRVCASVSRRAARLVAAGLVALIKKINKLDGCTVAVDGSLYKKHPTIKQE